MQRNGAMIQIPHVGITNRLDQNIKIQRLGREPSHEMGHQPLEMTGTKSESLLNDLVQEQLKWQSFRMVRLRGQGNHFDLDACGVIVSKIDYVIVKNIKTWKIETWSTGKMVRFT